MSGATQQRQQPSRTQKNREAKQPRGGKEMSKAAPVSGTHLSFPLLDSSNPFWEAQVSPNLGLLGRGFA
jgi:hypothetical protein